MICTDCKKEEAEWDFGEDENLCQMCFEKMCDKAWWEAVDEGFIF